MAVYQGARPRPTFLPPAAVERPHANRQAIDRPTIERRRGRIAVRAGRRSGRVGLALGAIVVVFMLAFFSLAQTIRVSASAYDVDRLLIERDQLDAARQQLLSDLNRLGREPAIRKQAIDFGLSQLAEPLVVPVH